ncbi:hypothetical protein EYC84_000393 [Monilinia fructicola]|uniref:Uncharacterized protein n=1 Tax=Monilinia fructicola TaxID=38448 RepID=A0A5M9JW34_MONFR|nr:hypothetical protein EYC84_000393 [Monilinia fructicola]
MITISSDIKRDVLFAMRERYVSSREIRRSHPACYYHARLIPFEGTPSLHPRLPPTQTVNHPMYPSHQSGQKPDSHFPHLPS